MFDRIGRAWVRHGPKTFVYLIFKNIAHYAQRAVSPVRRERSTLDLTFGIDTDGIVQIGQLDLDPRSESTRNAMGYEPSAAGIVEHALDCIPGDYRDFTFIDYGSGKGRVLILAARLPFREIIGVEFSDHLHAIAEQNIVRVAQTDLACKNISSVCCDAAAFTPPDGPLVCYFYNPFGRQVMERVIATLVRSLEETACPVYIIYVRPLHEDVVTATGRFDEVGRHEFFTVFRSKERMTAAA